MRKTQIALAAVALVASSAALADVKVAGCVDAAVVNTKAGTALGGAGDGCASQWGIYGSEDIGGLKASFNLEGGLNIANGTTGNGGSAGNPNAIFNRLANVGLGTKEATLTLGMAKSAWIEAAGGGLTAYGMNGIGVPALAMMNGNLSGTSQSGGFFVGNLAGISGDLGILSYNVQTTVNKAGSATIGFFDNANALSGGAGQPGTAVAGLADSYTALRLSAPVGAASVNFGYETRKNDPATALTGGNIDYSNWVVSTSVPLEGGFSVNAAYSRQSIGTGQDNTTFNAFSNNAAAQQSYLVGAGYKMSDAVGLGVTYVKNNNTQSMLGLSGQYNFSGRTVGYLNYADLTNAVALNNAGNAQPAYTGATATSQYTGRVISLGVHHAF